MIDDATLERQLDRTIRETHFDDLGPRYSGKVRDTYRAADELILITTDRISAFDHILPQSIPFKGQVLNQIAAYFFDRTSDVAVNHLIAVPDPNVTIATRCEPVPVEFVVRGYLAGHAWREYRAGRRQVCGEELPEDLVESSRLPRPILTPATKAAEGHDEDISRAEIVDRGILDAQTLDHLASLALRMFDRGTQMAAERGLILVDTKYEFGRTPGGGYVLIDEVHTPDSSRFYYADTYEQCLQTGEPQKQLSKEFVREWLMENGFQGLDGQPLPDMPDEFRIEVSRRYIELYERMTGTEFEPDTHPDPEERIRAAIERHYSR